MQIVPTAEMRMYRAALFANYRPVIHVSQATKHHTVGASSQCYWDELVLLKCQINTNTNKSGFLLSTKCLERVLKYSCLVSIIYIFFLCLSVLQPFCVILLALACTLLASAHTLLALAHLNSSEKMHRLSYTTRVPQKSTDV